MRLFLERSGLSREEIPSGVRLRRVETVDRARVDASAVDGIVEDAIAAESAARSVVVAITGTMRCGSGLRRVERVRRRVGMRLWI